VNNGSTSTLQLQIEKDIENNLISYFPNQISLDPRVCIFKPSLNTYGDITGIRNDLDLLSLWYKIHKMFPSNGKNHHESIQVEKSMEKYKPRYEKNYNKKIEKFIHIGGTKNVIDFKIMFVDGSEITKSLKKKNNINKGSFDYINTSVYPEEITAESNNIYKNYRGKKDKIGEELLKEAISKDLKNLSSEYVTNLAMKVVNKYNQIGGLDIVETSTGKLFTDVVPEFFEVLNNGGYLKIRKTEKVQMSFMLDLYDSMGNLLPDTGLRLRLHLNNGWTKWHNGKSSNLVFKLQQDKVSKILQK
jgi:hypothetical protein